MKNYLSKNYQEASSWRAGAGHFWSTDLLAGEIIRISQVKKVSSQEKSQKLTKRIAAMTTLQAQQASELKNFYIS